MAGRRAVIKTLASACELRGVALHSGVTARVTLRPATAAQGLHFVRVDQPGAPHVTATPSAVTSTALSTTIGSGSATVATIEHLMAALCGLGVRACRIEVDAPELPLLDGSAARWVEAIGGAGLVEAASGSGAVCEPIALDSRVSVGEGSSWLVALPARTPRLTVGIDFPAHAPIGRQWASWAPPVEGAVLDDAADACGSSFATEVAPARTFGLHDQLAALREAGLIRGGSLDNALVCDATRWLNGPLRFPNEPARHKLLDLLGDLALLPGGLPRAHVVAFRASHRLHVALAKAVEATARGDASPVATPQR